MSNGIIYDYEDGGRYCGEWENDSSHGYGCGTGPGGRGVYEGLWDHGGQVSGTYTWPNGMKYTGTWKDNQRDGFGKEMRLDGTEYCGEFVRAARGPYGVARLPNGVYRGSWRNGKQDGEGEEVYLDGGCYRGQYKNGVRSGFGTRTSSAYEHRGKEAPIIHDPANKPRSFSTLMAVPFANLNKRSSVSSVISSSSRLSDVQDSSESPAQVGNHHRSCTNSNAQIYEGEWKDDRRHGYGVIKCIDSYTYYGQWMNNTRTGYGVMVYRNGTKEEGQWQNSELIIALKRKKLHLKTHQLETKVQTAHTQAIQAADSARNKALLSKSRAGSAMDKAKVAQGVALRAEKEAVMAREKAELHKNAPRISEGLKSPIAINLFPTSSSGSKIGDSPLTSRHLDVSHTFPHAPSFENIYSMTTTSPHDTEFEDRSDDDECDHHHRSAKSRRNLFSQSSSSSKGSKGSKNSTDDELGWKRREYADHVEHFMYRGEPQHEEIDAAHRRISEGVNVHRLRKNYTPHVRNLGDTLEEEEEEREEEGGEEEDSHMKRLQKRKLIRNKTTGEMEQYGTDEEMTEDHCPMRQRRKPILNKHRPLNPKNSLTMDMLINNMNQMANWNKIMACINFIILICLLFVILFVVISLNYYQLSSYYNDHSQEDQSPAPSFTPIA